MNNRKKKFVINALPLIGPLTGIGRYIDEVTKHLDQQQNKSISMFYYFGYYSKKLLPMSNNPYIKKVKTILVQIPILKRVIRKALYLSGKTSNSKFNLYWEPNFIPWDTIKSEKVITSIHDFSFVLHKEFHPKERIEYYEKNFFNNIGRSDEIICFSHFTKNEILQKLDFPSEKIHVIHHGIDHDLFKVYDDTSIGFELPEKFILSVGSIEPRKNLLGLLKAYNLLPDKLISEYKLVLVGLKEGWENDEIMRLIKNNRDNIHYLGFISDEELAKVYNRATVFVFPSFYEGFGLPILEAMACGTPVLCSDSSSLPEVGGDVAIYCDPYSIEDISEKMASLLNNAKLQEDMATRGIKRAQTFNWGKSAQEHMELFNKVTA